VATAIHGWLQSEHGNDATPYDSARLEAVLAGPRELHRDGTTDVFRLAARYALGAARDRPFGDSSDGVALVLAGVFLSLNGWQLEGSESDAVSVTRALASRELDASAFAMWLEGASRRAARRTA
jgi:prophage maintenance system killer protein